MNRRKALKLIGLGAVAAPAVAEALASTPAKTAELKYWRKDVLCGPPLRLPKLIMVGGPPGSDKSALATAYMNQSTNIVVMDLLHERGAPAYLGNIARMSFLDMHVVATFPTNGGDIMALGQLSQHWLMGAADYVLLVCPANEPLHSEGWRFVALVKSRSPGVGVLPHGGFWMQLAPRKLGPGWLVANRPIVTLRDNNAYLEPPHSAACDPHGQPKPIMPLGELFDLRDPAPTRSVYVQTTEQSDPQKIVDRVHELRATQFGTGGMPSEALGAQLQHLSIYDNRTT